MHPALAELPSWAAPFFPAPGRGVIHDLPEEQYHGTKALISKSALDIAARSLYHYRYSLDVHQDEDADALRIGHAFHAATLEPDLLDSKVIVMPDFGPMQSSKNRALRDAWIDEEAAGKTWLKQHEFDHVIAMRDAVHRHPAARTVMRRGRAEVTAVWTDPETGLRCKSRADWLSSMDGVFVDLKSAIDASPGGFRRAAANNRYHVQDAFYSRAFEENNIHIANFVFVVVEKEPPHAVAVYQLDDTARLKGEELYMAELRALREAIDSDVWPGYGDSVQDLRLPGWATMDLPT